MYYWHFNVAPVYFWLKFQLKREQDIETYLLCICLLIGRVNITKICDCKWATKQHKMCFIKGQTAKSKITCNRVCVLARHKLWRFFFISNVYRACMLLWKRFTIFPRNLSCQRSYFRWKLVGLFFLRFPGWKWKICRDQSRLTFSSRGYAARACASILACAPMWACSQAIRLSVWAIGSWNHKTNVMTTKL